MGEVSIKELIQARMYSELRKKLFDLEREKIFKADKKLEEIEEPQKEILRSLPFKELAKLVVIFAEMERKGPSSTLLEILVQDELKRKWDDVINEDMNRIAKMAKKKEKDK